MEEITKLDTIIEVQEWVSKMMKNKFKTIYRGQGDSDWKLESKFIRETKKNLGNTYYNNYDLFLFQKKYFSEKIKYLSKELNQNNQLFLLSQMQHFGKRTPLIDFTSDILVSLYFAASYENIWEKDHEYFKIFYLKINDKIEDSLEIDDVNFEEIKVLKLKTIEDFNRSISQKSHFLFDTLILNKDVKSICIKYNLRIKILDWLEKMDISFISLFPDYEGILKNYDSLSTLQIFLDGLALTNAGKYENAIKKYKNLVDKEPYNVIYYNNQVYCLLKLKKIKDAIELSEEIIKKKIAISSTYSNLGEALFMNYNFDKSIKNLKIAIKEDSKNDDAYANLGYVLVMEKNFNNDHIEEFKNIQKIDFNSTRTYNNWKNKIIIKHEFIDKAIENLETAIKINRNNIAAHNMLNFLIKIKEKVKNE